MVKSPAALVPCCKTIPPLWEAVEFPLSMVQITPACKPLTEMFLDSISAAGRGRGREGEWGVVTSGRHFNSLGSIAGKCWFFCIFNSACGCVARVESAPAKGTVLSRQRVQDPCVGSQVNLAVYTSPVSSLRGFVKPGSFSRWPFGLLSPSHTPAVPPVWIVGPSQFFSLTTVIF